MADSEEKPKTETAASEAKKPSKLPLILGVVAALGFGGGGFYAAYSGLLAGILGGSGGEAADAGSVAKGGHGEDNATASADKGHGATDEAHGTGGSSATAAFVEIDPLIVSLGSGRDLTHLRFRAHLEIVAGAEETVLSLMPRVMDVLNGYLRAMKPEELADPTMLIRLRAQMLRRVQLVVGEGLVKDLLVAEFVLN